ncbi:hypothetical protein GCM10008957_56430 [Deinococcus ruber]|uniref:Uncharacterized protein n=2 Tax=Deinococcus ruber TaxID=1848197 RepID=A0A918FIW2_9DEIO|nr:hypothetical protein GCM10008957_56430 [Deinococcus ruber]
MTLSSTLDSLAPSLKTDIYDTAITKLTAYRVPFSSTCKPNDTEIYFRASALAFTATFTGYDYGLILYRTNLLPGYVSIYDRGSLAGDNKTGYSLSQAITQGIGGLIDGLAADYAKANP